MQSQLKSVNCGKQKVTLYAKGNLFFSRYQGKDTEEERERAFLDFEKKILSDNQGLKYRSRRQTSACRHLTPDVVIML